MKCQKCPNEVAHPRMSTEGYHGFGWRCRCGWFNKKPKQHKQRAKQAKTPGHRCPVCNSNRFWVTNSSTMQDIEVAENGLEWADEIADLIYGFDEDLCGCSFDSDKDWVDDQTRSFLNDIEEAEESTPTWYTLKCKNCHIEWDIDA